MHRALRPLLSLLLAALISPAAGAAPAAPPPAPQVDGRGLLYGRVTTRGGAVYEGRLRWSDEEASWVDLFNSGKNGNPWRAAAGHEPTPRRVEVLGVPLPFASNPADEDRQFIARFGDMHRIEVGRGDDAKVWMKSGIAYPIHDGSNDVGSDIRVWDAKAGEVILAWSHIATIEFLPAPAALTGPARLFGTVRTREGDFTGTLQWNMRQGLVTDLLRGEEADARKEIPFSDITAIERLSDTSSQVTLHDGRRLTLSGSSDVGRGNFGVFVDDPRYGRVLVAWGALERVDFRAGVPGPAYGDFPPGKPLRGKVTTRGGQIYGGRLVFDLDEAETWEFLNGNHLSQRRAVPLPPWMNREDDPAEIQFNVPIPLVAAVVPIDGESAHLLLRDGRDLVLEGETDVGEWNGGMLIYASPDAKPVYVAWKDVQRVDFEP